MSRILFEICVESLERATEAQRAGAWRIELCSALSEGGITPSHGLITRTRKELDIRLHPIIRPRGGDFVYSNPEFEIMKEDIRFCGETGCDGVVFGILLPDRRVDSARTKELTDLAASYGMSTTFHRAIDEASDIFDALEAVAGCGCDRILTSGGKESVPEGAGIIRQMIEQAGERILIMPGCGITRENVERLIEKTGAREIHGTFRNGFPERMKPE